MYLIGLLSPRSTDENFLQQLVFSNQLLTIRELVMELGCLLSRYELYEQVVPYDLPPQNAQRPVAVAKIHQEMEKKRFFFSMF